MKPVDNETNLEKGSLCGYINYKLYKRIYKNQGHESQNEKAQEKLSLIVFFFLFYISIICKKDDD